MNFHSLGNYRDKNWIEKKEKDKRKTTDSYTGGKSSGIAVDNPEDDWLNKMKKHDNKEQFDKTKNKFKLILYKNSFELNDREFKNKNALANKKFMEEVERGYIPNELVKKGYSHLGIEMDDLSEENY